MFSLTSYVVFWVLVFLVLGIFWYGVDKKYGAKLRRWWINRGRKEKLPLEDDRGLFVYKRSTKRKFTVAAVVSTIQTLFVWFNTEVNPLVEVILWAVEIPVTMIGFYLAGPVRRIGSIILSKIFPWFDKIERGETTVGKELASAGGRLAEATDGVARRVAHAVEDRVRDTGQTPEKFPVKEPEPKPEPVPDTSPEEKMNAYLKGGKR